MYGFDHAGMGLGGFGMILFWLIPITLVIWLFARFQGNDKPAASRTPLEILDERYARGEVGREEYLSRRADLERKDAS